MIIGGKEKVEADPAAPAESEPATPTLPKPRSGTPTE
jgi:hypothetical protein